MSGSLNSLEILSTGLHHASTGDVRVTEDDLDQIIEAFHALEGSNIVKPHLKLGHTDAQKWFGQRDGIPSLGWITNIWKSGTKLLANVADIPDALIDLIRQGRYHNVSSEIIWGRKIDHNGKSFSRVLSAVSLLGVEMPAVKDLSGLASALFKEIPGNDDVITLTEEPNMPPEDGKDNKVGFSQTQVDALVKAAVDKAIGDVKTEFSTSIADLKKQNEVLKIRAETAEGETKKLQSAAVTKEAEDLIAKAIKDGKLLPKQKDIALSMLQIEGDVVKFGESELTPKQAFTKFLELQGKVVDLSEAGNSDGKPKEFSSAAQELDHEVKKLVESQKISYAEAFDKILASNEDLAARYMNSTS